MSIKTLWQSILLAFGHIPKDIDKYATELLAMTIVIKKALDNPTFNIGIGILTAAIPGDTDDKAVTVIKGALANSLKLLQIVDECKGKSVEDMLGCWIEAVSKLPKDARNGLLAKLYSKSLAFAHGHDLPQNMYDLYAQFVYSRESKKNE